MIDAEGTPLLPIVRQSSLDSIPVASIVLSIREIINSKVDTSVTFEQLRTPQVSNFLLRPILEEIKQTLNISTVFCLLVNMIQYIKEGNQKAALVGIMNTRSSICEIIAMKLLKEFEDDALIEGLTYDFYPLQSGFHPSKNISRWERISGIELAIKAKAKHFLSHPVIIQIIEEIWYGSIVFTSSLNKFHRIEATDTADLLSSKFTARDSPSRYRYESSSLFKLSRLRVPFYRHCISTFSTAVLLVLYLLVLQSHSSHLTLLEVIFWIWVLGFLGEEAVGFGDTGVALYVLSLWNIFDLLMGIFLLSYVCIRIINFLIPYNPQRFKDLNNLAYDFLATVAIFLSPRIFSIFDNYPAFSNLMISLRKMFIDLAGLLAMILVFTSGFFIAFAMILARSSFSPLGVAYQLMQVFFGYTPAIWEAWDNYSVFGKGIALLFMFMCHFLVITILVTVLTNSFAAVYANSNKEHHFLFAINTITMIKSNSSSLFLYAPPINILEWVLSPLVYLMPIRNYIILNRTIIKITHFPALLLIYVYERFYLLRIITMTNKESYKALSGDLEETMNIRRQESRVALRKKDRLGVGSRPSAVSRNLNPSNKNSKVSTKQKQNEVPRKHKFSGGINLGFLSHTNKSKISRDEVLDEVFKRPYKGTIKLKGARGGNDFTNPTDLAFNIKNDPNMYDKYNIFVNSEEKPEIHLKRTKSDIYGSTLSKNTRNHDISLLPNLIEKRELNNKIKERKGKGIDRESRSEGNNFNRNNFKEDEGLFINLGQNGTSSSKPKNENDNTQEIESKKFESGQTATINSLKKDEYNSAIDKNLTNKNDSNNTIKSHDSLHAKNFDDVGNSSELRPKLLYQLSNYSSAGDGGNFNIETGKERVQTLSKLQNFKNTNIESPNSSTISLGTSTGVLNRGIGSRRIRRLTDASVASTTATGTTNASSLRCKQCHRSKTPSVFILPKRNGEDDYYEDSSSIKLAQIIDCTGSKSKEFLNNIKARNSENGHENGHENENEDENKVLKEIEEIKKPKKMFGWVLRNKSDVLKMAEKILQEEKRKNEKLFLYRNIDSSILSSTSSRIEEDRKRNREIALANLDKYTNENDNDNDHENEIGNDNDNDEMDEEDDDLGISDSDDDFYSLQDANSQHLIRKLNDMELAMKRMENMIMMIGNTHKN